MKSIVPATLGVALCLASANRTGGANNTVRVELSATSTRTAAPAFQLQDAAGQTVSLADYGGKVVLLNFWATWCGPCRVQHPLYEEVKDRFKDRDDIVFVNINTDEDPSLVKPFLERSGWNNNVYFEDGLSQLLRVSSIPTTVVINKQGKIHVRLNGFVPEKFVDQLTGIIREAL